MKKTLISLVLFGLIPIAAAQDWSAGNKTSTQVASLQFVVDGAPIIININAGQTDPFDEGYGVEPMYFEEIVLTDARVDRSYGNRIVIINILDQGVTFVLSPSGSETLPGEGNNPTNGGILPDEDDPQGSRTTVAYLPETGVTIIRAPRSIDQ